MVGIRAAIELDERGGLNDPDKLGVERLPIEPVPRDVIERPTRHAAPGVAFLVFTPS